MMKGKPGEKRDRVQRLWLQVGLRLQNRRVQLGLSEVTVAEHIGVPLARYRAFEAGRAETPADLLAQLADYLGVSIFNFFHDVLYGEIEPSTSTEPAPVFTIATDEDRAAGLLNDFRKLDRQRQQCLLLLARALVEDTRED
jgi:transcriptional regulator with XRE-family HTH domain